MKVTSSTSVGQTGSARGAARPASGGFAVESQTPALGAAPSARVAGTSPVSSIDALLALQSVGTPLERRRRAVGRAGRILDLLDDVKVALLEGAMNPSALATLVAAVHEQRDRTDDPRLEGVLDEIETRAAVELAKFGMAA
ncbi:MAG TPA: flagellar assembly protein FliX [Caulobacteraceae bacterium]|jgi:hypothetical protein|nr:flagellar assembly protein FliX [Caulobacteraceae bacterium]